MLEPLDSYLQTRRERGGAAVRDELDSPILVIFANGLRENTGFRTMTVSSEIAREAGALALANTNPGFEAEGAFAARVRKVLDSPWGDRISIGRARNNDICIPHGSLSKLHAHILPTDGGGASIRDADSKNGTLLDGELVAASTAVPLDPGSTIQMGDVIAVYHSPDTFRRFLRLLDAALDDTKRRREARARRKKKEEG